MIQTTLKIDGMMCGMCESHINDAIRKDFSVKKVIDATGYTLLNVQSQPYEKKGGLAGLFHRK